MNILSWWPIFFLIPLPILGVWLVSRVSLWQTRNRMLQLVPKGALFRVSLPLVAFLFLIGALLRPYTGTQEIEFPSKGRDIILIFDVSRSMLARDIKPSRLEFARRKALDFVELLFNNSATNRIGIVLFAGESYLFCPLTNDRGVLRNYLKSAQPELITAQGSSIVGAIGTAVGALSTGNATETALVLMTDGEDKELPLESIHTMLNRAKSTLYVVGIGTEKGAAIELPDGSSVRDANGDEVVTKLDTKNLINLAQGVGTYYPASLGDQDLIDLVAKLNPVEQTQTLRAITIHKEYGFIFLLGTALIFICAPWSKKTRHLLPILILMAWSQDSFADELCEGKSLYAQKEYPEATQKFKRALEKDPDDLTALQGLGSSQFKAGDLESAVQTFKGLTTKAPDLFDGHYDLGNSYLAQLKPKEAIEAYDKALKISPDDIRAKTNREIAEKLLEKSPQSSEEEQSPTPTPEPSKEEDNQDSKQNENPSPESSPTPSEEEQKDSQGKPQATPTGKPTARPQPSEKEAEEKKELESKPRVLPGEADQLLDAMPDAPLLLKRKRMENNSPPQQTW